MDEDIVLLEKSLITPKKWAKISVHCYGRNQHNIKNRFIALINKEFNFKWEQTKDTMKRCDLTNLIQKTLKSLYVIKNENSAEKTQSKKNTLDDNNSSSNNSISSNHNRSQKAVKYIYGEKNETYEEEKWLDSTFIDYKN